MDLKIAGKYKVSQKLGSGAFGEIHHGIISLRNIGINVKTSEEVAIKLVIQITYIGAN